MLGARMGTLVAGVGKHVLGVKVRINLGRSAQNGVEGGTFACPSSSCLHHEGIRSFLGHESVSKSSSMIWDLAGGIAFVPF